MQVYLVGGAVRDELLGLPVGERDWVVVGATPEQLTAQGYRAVGRDFPVFLHPDTHEEYALARLERKSGPGYRGFVTDFAPTVTVEEDLKRRDLTVNALARAADGTVIDPCGGQADLDARVLRHVSPAFSEDPVRILRAARFLARFAPLGFVLAPETLALMRTMVASGEVAALVPERVWRELARALAEPRSDLFFATLADCGALAVLMPELAAAWQVAARAQQDQRVLQLAATAGTASATRWAALLAPLPQAQIGTLCARLRAPAEFRELAETAARLGAHLHAGATPPPVRIADPDWVLGLLEMADAWRRPERFEQWLQVLQVRAQADGVPLEAAQALARRLRAALTAASTARLDAADQRQLQGRELATRLHERRRAAIAALSAPG